MKISLSQQIDEIDREQAARATLQWLADNEALIKQRLAS